jgi:V/A-type H+-transporting ATPase subunit A
MPGEEGYPAYLATRLAGFYERAGRVQVLGREAREGSLSVIGAVSPPGADFSEPMTQNSLRVAGAFWALDYDLSRRRHFPAINWIKSYSLFRLEDWFGAKVASDWSEQVHKAMALLQHESELQEIAQLVGTDALAEAEKAILHVARIVREDFLQQYAYDPVDAYCSPEKQYGMLRAILTFDRVLAAAVQRGISLDRAMTVPAIAELGHMKSWPLPDALPQIDALIARLSKAFEEL